jgi:CheY-like chemotaxis protein
MIKALVLDDDKDISELFKVVGAEHRVWTITFTNGTEALKFLDNNTVDVVILDLMMSPIDGLTIAEQIRLNEENRPNEPRSEIVFLSGAEISDTIKRVANRVGVRRICQKPCEIAALLEEVKTWFPEKAIAKG